MYLFLLAEKIINIQLFEKLDISLRKNLMRKKKIISSETVPKSEIKTHPS
jgi:hypothetical protein